MPFYFGTTCIEKVAALQGGAAEPSLSKIVVKTPPTKLSYITGDTVDTTGMVLSVYIGDSLIIDITDGWTVSPTTIAGSTTELVFSYTLNGITKTTSQAISVSDYSTTLAENSWATIAKFAALGMADQLWNIGDMKPLAMGGNIYTCKIVDFNHYSLDSTDAKYNDSSYNGGKNKTAITFMCMEPHGPIDFRVGNYVNYHLMTIAKTTMPALKQTLPADLQSNLRTVLYRFTTNGSSQSNRIITDFCLPAVSEIFAANISSEYAPEVYRFAYFTNGNKTESTWINDKNHLCHTRSNFNDTQGWVFYTNKTNGTMARTNIELETTVKNYYIMPIFCI